MSLDDFEDCRLNAVVFPQHTVESSFRHNRHRGLSWNIDTTWERAERLGQGAFGSEVWRELHLQDNDSPKSRVVKIINKQQLVRQKIDFKKDVLAVAKYSKVEQDENSSVFVSFYGWYETKESVFLAMEYFQYGDLSQHTDFTENDVKDITRDLLHGLRIMRNEGLVHGDLKPQNIFVVEKRPESLGWRVKLGDFGFSKRVKDLKASLKLRNGTMQFLAPEMFDLVGGEMYECSSPADVWSLGCIIFTISARHVPFQRLFDATRYRQGRQALPDHLLSAANMSELGIQFVRECLKPEPSKRITIDDALDDFWVLTRSHDNPRPATATVRQTGSSSDEEPSLAKPVCFQDNQNEHQQPSTMVDITALPLRPTKDLHVEKPQSSRVTPRESLIPSRRDSIPLIQVNSPNSQLSHAVEIEVADRDSQETVIPFRSPRQQEKSADYSAVVDKSSTVGRFVQPHELRTQFETSGTLDDYQVMIYSVAFSPDGKLLASGSSDKTIKIRDRTTGKLLDTLEGHTDIVRSIAFSPNGKLLASASDDQTTRLWHVGDAANRHMAYILKHGCERSIAVSPNGKPFSSGSNNLSTQFWREQILNTAHTGYVTSVAFSLDGKLLASGLSDATVRLWDVAEIQPSDVVRGHKGWMFTVAFSPDGKLLASGSGDSTIRLWNIAKSTVTNVLYGHTNAVSSVAFSPDGKLLVSGSWDYTIRLWDTVKGKVITQPWKAHEKLITQVAFSPFKNTVVSSSADGTVRFWSLDGQLLLKLGEQILGITAIALSLDAELLVCAQSDTIRLWGITDDTVRNFEKVNKRQFDDRQRERKRQSRTFLKKRLTWS